MAGWRLNGRSTGSGLSARTVVVKLKYSDFSLRSRRVMLREPVADTGSIHQAAVELLRAFPRSPLGVRLTGVAATHLDDGPPAPTLFPDVARAKRTKVEGLIADIEERFGTGLTRAALLPTTKPKRP